MFRVNKRKVKSFLSIILAYIFLCQPIYASEEYGDSNVGVISATAATMAPSNLTALSRSPRLIVIAWKDNSDNETGFKIEKKLGNCSSTNAWTQIAIKPANATTHTISGLTPNTVYSFRIRAYQAASNSPYSNCAFVKTAVLGTPTSPVNLKAESVSSSKVNLNWNDNSANETGFKIYRKAGTGPWTLRATTGANIKSFSDTTAINNSSTTSYQYYVAAFNASGNSPSTYAAVVPCQPMHLTAEPGAAAGAIKLTWTDKSSNESGFEIWRKPGLCSASGTWNKVATLGANKTIWTNAVTGYSYKIRAYRQTGAVLPATGNSLWSNCAGIGGSAYTGLKNQAKISMSNIQLITEMTLGILFGEESQIPIISGMIASNSPGYSVSVQLENSLVMKLLQIKKELKTSEMIIGATAEHTENGECGGSLTITGEDGSDKTGNVSIDATVNFFDFCECDLFDDEDCGVQYIYNGKIKGVGNGVSVYDDEDYYLESAQITYSIDNLNTRVFEDSSLETDLTMNGSVEKSWTDLERQSEENRKMDVVRMDNMTNKSTWLNNLTLDSTQDFSNYKATITVNGRIYYQDYGYIDIQTATILLIDMTKSVIPASGVLVVTGSNGTKMRIVFSNGSYSVGADLNGDGIYELNF